MGGAMANTLFFWLSKLVWVVIKPDFFLMVLILAGTVWLFAGKLRRAKFLLGVASLAMVVIAVCPLGIMLLNPLEHRFPSSPDLPEKADGIIMLGGAEDNEKTQLWQQPEIKKSADRYVAFIRLMHIYPNARHIFAGGSASLIHQDYRDADTARQVFESLGVDVSSMEFEGNSRNSFENVVNVKALVHPEPGQVWILVTTAAHMPRSVGIFNRLNWTVIPFPVDHHTRPDKSLKPTLDFSGNLFMLNRAVREWIGLAAYYITGKTNAFFPSMRKEAGF